MTIETREVEWSGILIITTIYFSMTGDSTGSIIIVAVFTSNQKPAIIVTNATAIGIT
jgi:hypothetical protein